MNLLNKLFGGNTLYYPGCLTKFVAVKLQDNYMKILTKTGIDFIVLKDLEVCCGSPVLNGGYEKEAKKLAQKNFDIFREHAVKKIITSCPACYKTFSKEYPLLVKEWDIEAEHITQTIFQAMKKNKYQLKKLDIKINYHDPCHLGRACNIYDEPRNILEKSGCKVVEMTDTKERSFCCGGGGGLRSNNESLAKRIAKLRLKQCKTGTLVTTCPLCYLQLKENAGNKKVLELSEVIL
ncbi:MAG: (Fe-S)-binding protein [Candidatus Aenigmarchaeota archaeon]|nr:(Fe-S)-binding protein [Candidatus Aenigmarchaeota archaeon]